jgi:purine-binding chemotaxis protein CheW
MVKKLVVFELADELYGVDIFDVREIVGDTPVTRIPRAPDFLEGVVNLRGKLIPVIDLRKRFGFAKREKTRETRVIIADVSGKEVGLVVDSVREVATVEENSIEPAPAMTTMNAAFLEGLAKIDNKLIIIIRLDMLLEVEEEKILEHMDRQLLPADLEASQIN